MAAIPLPTDDDHEDEVGWFIERTRKRSGVPFELSDEKAIAAIARLMSAND